MNKFNLNDSVTAITWGSEGRPETSEHWEEFWDGNDESIHAISNTSANITAIRISDKGREQYKVAGRWYDVYDLIESNTIFINK